MKCLIQWIDCAGKVTPDDNEAVGLATSPHGNVYPVCSEHLKTLRARTSHHQEDCPHHNSYSEGWSFESFAEKAKD